MRAYIINDGEVLGEYPIADNDPISADHRARKYAADVHGATVEQCCDKPKHYVPCGGDFSVTVAEGEQRAFGAVCWESRNYFFDEGASA